MKPAIRRIFAVILSLSMLITAASALSVEDALELLDTVYLREIPEEARDAESLDELFYLLGDPYTYYMDPDEYYDFIYSVEDTQELVGIGVQIQFTEEGILILNTISGSPARHAGLQPGDLIVAIEDTSCVPANESHQALILGPSGTYVRITVLRDGVTEQYSLRRQLVTMNNTDLTMLEGGIGYLDCNSFGSDTGDLVYEYLNQYDSEADHWLLDLRSNVGGYTDAAVLATGAFAGPGIYLYLRDKYESTEYYVHTLRAATEDSLIVLVDGNSASASEALAANIRDTRRGLVVGSRTYGKGVAQIVVDEDNLPQLFSGDAVKITAYQFYSSLGNTTDLIGVIPALLMDPQLAWEVSVALCGSFREDYVTEGQMLLRIDGQYYYFDPNALSPEAASALLAALPPTAQLHVGANTYSWNEITVDEAAALMGVSYESRYFDDVADSPYADEINTLAVYRLLLGDGSGKFLPDGQLTRAQICAMLAQLLDVTYSGPSRFDDVDDSAWYAADVNAMAHLGFVEGDGTGLFHPDKVLSQQEFFAILGRMARHLNFNVDDFADTFYLEDGTCLLDYDPLLTPFADWARVETALLARSAQAVQAYGTMLFADLAELSPTAPITREEAAACMCRMLTVLSILPS